MAQTLSDKALLAQLLVHRQIITDVDELSRIVDLLSALHLKCRNLLDSRMACQKLDISLRAARDVVINDSAKLRAALDDLYNDFAFAGDEKATPKAHADKSP